MDKSEAIELLKQALTEIPQLKHIHHDNQQFILWHDKVRNIIMAAFDTEDVKRFSSWQSIHLKGLFSDDVYQQDYLKRIQDYETALKSIIYKYNEILRVNTDSVVKSEPPKAFIAHGGKSGVLDKLCEFISALGIAPLIVELMPTKGMSVDEKVKTYMGEADCGIVLATKGGIIDTKSQKQHPRLNVIDELERLRAAFTDKTILLVEKGVDLPSNLTGLTYEPFARQSMDRAFIAIARELVAYGILKSAKNDRF